MTLELLPFLLCPCAHPVGWHSAGGCNRAPVDCECVHDASSAQAAAFAEIQAARHKLPDNVRSLDAKRHSRYR